MPTGTVATTGRRKARFGWAGGFIGVGILLAIWSIISLLGVVSPELFPAPWIVAQQFVKLLIGGDLLVDLAVSTARVICGVTIGLVLAIPVGIALAWFRPVRAVVEPLVNFFRSIPPIALSPLIIVYLGIGELARVGLLVWATFFTSIVLIFEGVRAIDEIYIRAARVVGATEREIFQRVVLPLLVPQVFVALRLSIGINWATLVAAELIAAQSGIGSLIQNAANFFAIPTIYTGIICIGAMALLMDKLVQMLMRRAVAWQESVVR